MKVLLSGGVKTQNIVNAIGKKFESSGDEFRVVEYIEHINDIYEQGDYYDKAIIMDQSITHDGNITDEAEMRQLVNDFAEDCAQRVGKKSFVFLAATEDMANLVCEEIMAINRVSTVVLKAPKYSVSFFCDLIVDDVHQLPQNIVFKPAEITSEYAPEDTGNTTSIDDIPVADPNKLLDDELGTSELGTEYSTPEPDEYTDQGLDTHGEETTGEVEGEKPWETVPDNWNSEEPSEWNGEEHSEWNGEGEFTGEVPSEWNGGGEATGEAGFDSSTQEFQGEPQDFGTEGDSFGGDTENFGTEGDAFGDANGAFGGDTFGGEGGFDTEDPLLGTSDTDFTGEPQDFGNDVEGFGGEPQDFSGDSEQPWGANDTPENWGVDIPTDKPEDIDVNTTESTDYMPTDVDGNNQMGEWNPNDFGGDTPDNGMVDQNNWGGDQGLDGGFTGEASNYVDPTQDQNVTGNSYETENNAVNNTDNWGDSSTVENTEWNPQDNSNNTNDNWGGDTNYNPYQQTNNTVLPGFDEEPEEQSNTQPDNNIDLYGNEAFETLSFPTGGDTQDNSQYGYDPSAFPVGGELNPSDAATDFDPSMYGGEDTSSPADSMMPLGFGPDDYAPNNGQDMDGVGSNGMTNAGVPQNTGKKKGIGGLFAKKDKNANKQEQLYNGMVNPAEVGGTQSIQQPGVNQGKLNPTKVIEDLKPFAARGNSIVVTGCGGCGTSTLAYNLANIASRIGYSVLLVDMDTEGRTQSYISKSNYDCISPDSSNLMSAVNSSTGINNYTSIARPGLNLLTMGMGSDTAPVSELIHKEKISRFMNLAKTSYNFIIYDIPFQAATGFLSEMVYMADNIVLVTDASNWGVTKTLISMCNIASPDIQDTMFNRAQVVFNKYRRLNKVFGKKVKSGNDILVEMDKKVFDLLGEDIGLHFESMRIAGIVNDDPEMEDAWYSDVQYSDTAKGQQIFLKLLHDILMIK